MQASKILNFADSLKLDDTIVFSRSSGTNTHPGTYIDSNGIMQELSYNTPRFHFNPVTGISRGLLFEEARTNLLLHSGDFSKSAWQVFAPMTKTGITRAGLGGDLTGYTFTTSLSGGLFYQDILASGTLYQAVSLFIHTSSTCNNATLGLFWLLGGTTQNISLQINPQTGDYLGSGATGATLLEYRITPYANGWYRYEVLGKGLDALNTLVRYQCYSNNGDARTLVVDKAQLENEEFCTLYIPTGLVAITRNKDYAYIPALDFNNWFNFSEGTLVVEYDRPTLVSRHTRGLPLYTIVALIGGWNIGRYLIIDYGSAGAHLDVVINLLVVFLGGRSNSDVNITRTLVLTWKKNSIAFAHNGELVAQNTSSDIPNTLTQNILYIGNEGSNATLNGCIRLLIYIPKRVSNEVAVLLSQRKVEDIKPIFSLSFLNEQVPRFLRYLSSAAMRRKANGVLEMLSANTPRFDWSDSKCLGLLMEKQSTNMLPYADLLQGWGIVNLTESKNTTETLDPMGGNTATKLTASLTGSIAFYRTSTAISPLTVYTISGYFKKGTSGFFFIGFLDNVDLGCNVTVNADTLLVLGLPFGGWTYVSSVVESLPNGWYRVILTALSNSLDTTTTGYLLHTNHNVSNTGTSGQYGYIWGPQMEPGYIATLLIPNLTSSSVTRVGDQAVISTSNKILLPMLPTDVSYVKTNCTIGGSPIGMPFGNIGDLLGFKLVEDSTNSYKTIYKFATPLLKTSITVSLWMLKKDTNRPWVYTEANVAGTRAYSRFNFDTYQFDDYYTSGGATILLKKAYPYPDGWVKIVQVTDHGTLGFIGAPVSNLVSLANASGATLYTGDNALGTYIGAFQCYELVDGLTTNEPFFDCGTAPVESAQAVLMAWLNPVEGTILKELYHAYDSGLKGTVQETNSILLSCGRGGFYQLRDVNDPTAPYHDLYAYAGSPTKSIIYDATGISSVLQRLLVQTLLYSSGSFNIGTDIVLETLLATPTLMPYCSAIYIHTNAWHSHLQRLQFFLRKMLSRATLSKFVKNNDIISPLLNLQFAKSKTFPSNITFSRNDSTTCASVIGPSGDTVLVPPNIPRITHSSSNSKCLGLLVEETRTQLAPKLDLIGALAEYALSGTTIVDNTAIVNPSGQSLVTAKIVETSTTGQHLISKDRGARVVGEKFSILCVAKAAERTQLVLTAHGEGYSVFNLDTGTIYQTGGNVCFIEPLQNGWFRCTAIITKTNVTGIVYAGMWYNNTALYLGVAGSGLYVKEFQFELQPYSSSYIYNNSTGTLVRQGDYSVISGTEFSKFINKTEGTIVARFTINSTDTATAVYPTLFCLSDGTYNNRINCSGYRVGGPRQGISVVVGGVTQLDNGGPSIFGSTVTIAASYKANSFILAINGKIEQHLTGVALVPPMTQLDIGHLLGGNYLNGTIEYLMYYPKQLLLEEHRQLSSQ